MPFRIETSKPSVGLIEVKSVSENFAPRTRVPGERAVVLSEKPVMPSPRIRVSGELPVTLTIRERSAGRRPSPSIVTVPVLSSHDHSKPFSSRPTSDTVDAAKAVRCTAGMTAGTIVRLMDASSRADTRIFTLRFIEHFSFRGFLGLFSPLYNKCIKRRKLLRNFKHFIPARRKEGRRFRQSDRFSHSASGRR